MENERRPKNITYGNNSPAGDGNNITYNISHPKNFSQGALEKIITAINFQKEKHNSETMGVSIYSIPNITDANLVQQLTDFLMHSGYKVIQHTAYQPPFEGIHFGFGDLKPDFVDITIGSATQWK